MDKQESQYSLDEAEQRLRTTLRAAFNMKPTPLKDIPKRTGESRLISRKKRHVSDATAKNARP